MAEEEKNPLEKTAEAVEEVIDTVSEKAEEVVENVEEAAEAVAEEVEEAEQLGDVILPDAVDEQPSKEEQVVHTEPMPAGHGHAVPDTTMVMGRELPFNIYTSVFLLLAVLTVFELILGEIEIVAVRAFFMIILMAIKAVLVVWYYMHLNKDSRLFMWALIIPTILSLIAMFYLLSVPQGY